MANLLFDTNYILYKNVFTLHKMNRLFGFFHESLDNNIAKYVAMNKWDNVYLVSDSNKKSWRKDFLDNYKGTRTKMEGIDWDWVFTEFVAWKEKMKEKYPILQKDRVEGDDWIASIVLKTNKMGQSNVIITSDEDMPQLLDYKIDGEKSFINMQIIDHTGQEKVYLPEGWQLWLKEFDDNRSTDIFNLDNGYEWISFFNRVTSQWQYQEINPKQRLFTKIVMGDKSDNIRSIYEKLTTTGKIQGIGKAGAEKIWNFYKDNYKDYFNTKDKNFIPDVINCIERVNDIKLTDEKRAIVYDNMQRNIKLIELHYRHFPDWVVEDIIEVLNEKI